MSRGFRVWDIEKKEYADLVSATFSLSGELLSTTKKNGRAPVLADNYIVEQDTGLEDKNGKEIYEGDIVRLYGSFVSVITWQDDCCGFKWYNNSGDGYCGLGKDNEEYYKVIGNIHENPELLGGEE